MTSQRRSARRSPSSPARISAGSIGFAAAVATAVVLAWPAAARGQSAYFDPTHTYRVPVGSGAVLGPADAPVTIVEFADYMCRYCRLAQPTLRALRRLYGDSIRIVYRNNPLDPEDGTLPAEAALAAKAQGRFWPMHDRLFGVHKVPTRADLDRFARALGLDMVRFRRDLDSRHYRRAVLADWRFAHELGITGTPMFFVNGRPVDGAQPLSVFVPLVDAELAHARHLIRAGVPRDKVYDAIIGSGAPAADSSDDPADADKGHRLDSDKVYPVGLGAPSYRTGPADALVTVVEFSDFQCPFCGRVEPAVERLRRKYGADVRFVFRNFPLRFHAHAELAAEAAAAAAQQGKFWPYHDVLFRHQGALTRADLERYARRVGLDMAKFRAALERRTNLETVQADEAAGAALGVSGTPTFFVNGSPLVGAAPYATLAKLVDEKKTQAQALLKKGVARANVYDEVTGLRKAAARAALRKAAAKAALRKATSAAVKPGAKAAGASAAAEPHAAPLVFDQVDLQIATLLACKQGNPGHAALFYKKLRSGARRRMVRRDCRELGVKLPR